MSNFELLTALAYLQGIKFSPEDAFKQPCTTNLDMTCDNIVNQFIMDVRKWIDGAVSMSSVTMLMPYANSIELQGLRVKWMLNYWLSTSENECNRNKVGACDETNGYTTTGRPLFETPEAQKQMLSTMKRCVIKCQCKRTCAGRCGCRKEKLYCMICLCDSDKCNNRGPATQKPIESEEASADIDRNEFHAIVNNIEDYTQTAARVIAQTESAEVPGQVPQPQLPHGN